jgi:spoIIIJ-associated protein
MEQWVEVEGATVDVAVTAAMAELELSSPDQANVEVLQEPKAGFLGMGAKPAIVKVSRRPKPRRQRRRRGKKGGGEAKSAKSGAAKQRKPAEKSKGSDKGQAQSRKAQGNQEEARVQQKPESAPIEEQAQVAKEFLEGLLEAFGLDGRVVTRIEDDVLYLDVEGEQTEALVGAKGSVMQSVLELTRTTVQRKTFGAPRMRIDIAGYGARRREALQIYTGNLAKKVLEDGGEVMLEPMNAADRKAVHDAAAEIDGVRTYSEGEEPNRAVVIASEGDAG